jgi:bifunctional pyridoxal-dependent enzyme with beta-cystathionase and maltose regulon repressor activities
MYILPYAGNSISKTFNAGSLRGGFAIIRDDWVRGEYREVVSQISLYNNELGMMCMEVFYSREGERWIEHCLAIVAQNYNYLLQRIRGTRLLVSQLEAAYIITINFEGYLKHIQRWFAWRGKEGDRKHMVSLFLRERGIRGI